MLPLLRVEQRRLAWHLTQTYFAPRRRMLTCPRCDARLDAWNSTNFHVHGRRTIALVPRVLRVVPIGVKPALVDKAIGWLDERWRGEAFVPDELLPLVTAADV